jgi:outer membrane protein assembly factor BamB
MLLVRSLLPVLVLGSVLSLPAAAGPAADWPQWRGPARDGHVEGPAWPASLSGDAQAPVWRVKLGPGYSGPIVSADAVFVTETKDKSVEVVRALDRRTGRELWSHSWQGAISVPFFAKSRGDWIRATPAYDGARLYVAGMRDVLVALDARTGQEVWRVDFVQRFQTGVPDFGLVCSPLPDGDFLYLQAANSVVKLRKDTGETVWRGFQGGKGMASEGAFSSPVFALIGGRRQLVVQGREELAGLDPEDGSVLWRQAVPSFRGMNILTPTVVGDTIFTSSYQNRSWLYRVGKSEAGFGVTEAWNNNAQGYMSSPVVVGGHAYLHLGNGRFTCIDLANGTRTWTSDSFGKYASLVCQGDRILALVDNGTLLLLQADPQAFRLIDQRKVSEEDTWAHLAVSGEELFVRELKGMAVFRWSGPRPGAVAGNLR